MNQDRGDVRGAREAEVMNVPAMEICYLRDR